MAVHIYNVTEQLRARERVGESARKRVMKRARLRANIRIEKREERWS